MSYLINLTDMLYVRASDYLNAPTAGNILTQDMVNEVNLPLFFPHQPVQRAGFDCYRMIVMAESSPKSVQVSSYYAETYFSALERPLYVIDYDDGPDKNHQLWFLISVICRDRQEAREMLIHFAGRFGFTLRPKPEADEVLFLIAEPPPRGGRSI